MAPIRMESSEAALQCRHSKDPTHQLIARLARDERTCLAAEESSLDFNRASLARLVFSSFLFGSFLDAGADLKDRLAMCFQFALFLTWKRRKRRR